ncbi:type 1 periplasmic binding fold superfamily protein [Flavobacterium sp.]|uniref:type 1 periplasmic binding fold superfamily protein n=1 Tax=Flavobacterium sp. TaxID=239 RepID=UPI00260CC5A5|nr:type 1 periplasmic binding fold superfamily protein [Flavobacterium sp.]
MKEQVFIFVTLATALFTSCDDDSASQVIEEEVITTIEVTLTGGGETITLVSRDLDGDGPGLPVSVVSGNLTAGTTYTGSIVLKNETETPAEIKNPEILEKDEEHQFFYQTTGTVGTFTYTDADSNNNPIGLTFTLQTAATAGTGSITFTLRHELNKNGTGVDQGIITNAGGSTDIEVSFPVTIE